MSNGDENFGPGSSVKSPQVDAGVLSAIVNAYYPSVIASAEAARARAQNAYAIASAIAGALVVALVTSKSDTASTPAKVLGIVALAAWLAAAMLYIWAIAGPLQSRNQASEPNASSFVQHVIEDVESQRTTVDSRQHKANLAATAAMVFTVAAFSLLLFSPSATDPRSPGTVVLTPQGLDAVRQACPGATRTLTGLVDRTTLEGQFISLDPTGSICTAVHGSLRIGREQVVAVRLNGE